MKKTLSVILAVLLLFSAAGVMSVSAADSEQVRVVFFVDGEEYYAINVLPGVNFVDRLQQGDNVLETPVKASTETTEYTFRYWEKATIGDDGEFVLSGITTNTGNVPAVGEDEAEVYYVAVFAEEEIKENQSLWAFVRSIFERINMIFEYIAKVFEGVVEF